MTSYVNKKTEAIESLALLMVFTLITVLMSVLTFVFRSESGVEQYNLIIIEYGAVLALFAFLDVRKISIHFKNEKGLHGLTALPYAIIAVCGMGLAIAAQASGNILFVILSVAIAVLTCAVFSVPRARLIILHKDEKNPPVKGFFKKYASRTELK